MNPQDPFEPIRKFWLEERRLHAEITFAFWRGVSVGLLVAGVIICVLSRVL